MIVFSAYTHAFLEIMIYDASQYLFDLGGLSKMRLLKQIIYLQYIRRPK